MPNLSDLSAPPGRSLAGELLAICAPDRTGHACCPAGGDGSEQGLILVTARIEAHPAGRRELAQALIRWATSVRREPGSAAAHVYEDLEVAAPVFCLVSEWANRSALDFHIRGEVFGSMLGAVELLADRSVVAVTEAVDEVEASTTLRRIRDQIRHPHLVRLRAQDPPPKQESDV